MRSLTTKFSLALVLLVLPDTLRPTEAREIDFDRQVRPILADKCYACHGPDEEQRQADLRLDTEEGALEDRGGYAVIVPGNPDESELVNRIEAEGDDAMPPPEHPKQLTASEKTTLIEWIRNGAEWEAHWAYVPPQRFDPPLIEDHSWCKNWIDAFVLRTLQEQDLSPSPEASRRTLIRRLYLDLTGLPPTAEQVAALLDDPSPAAYETLVDDLLSSPHFGERLAIYWLDLVRYADTVGYHGDQDMSVSPYRDYVINAFNSDMPFDQFTREQLAGDLLDSASLKQLIASGYNRLGMMSAEGGVQPEEYLAKYAADRVRTASTVWMGATLGCAECHNHKFDPFTTKDFYRFAAFFADIKERGLYSGANRDGNWGPQIEVPDRGSADLLAPIEEEIEHLSAQLKTMTPALAKARRQWESEVRRHLGMWSVLVPQKQTALHDTHLQLQSDGSLLATGPNPGQNTYTLNFDLSVAGTTAVRLEALPHDSLPKHGPGRADNGNFVVTEVRATFGSGKSAKSIPFVAAAASFEQTAGEDNPYSKWSAASAIDSDEQGSNWGWAILPEVGESQVIRLDFAEPLGVGALRLTIEQQHTNPKHTLGRFRIWTTVAAADVVQLPPQVPDAIARLIAIAEDLRTAAQQEQINRYFLDTTDKLESTRQRLADLKKEWGDLKAKYTRTSLITVSVEPREMRVLPRGNWMDKSGGVVEPGVPEFLGQAEHSERLTRLDLANWLVDRKNPLTARVFVNRLWKLYFGAGLSKVLDDIGSQGELPSHPELLDTLAVEFMESGWNVKHMVKEIVMSATYRQSSLPREELRKTDPYNRLLARQSRYRLDAEVIRDNALAISGLLVHALGGRSAKPYQPEGLYRHLNFPPREYQADTDKNQYRRGVYTHWQRQFLHPAMQAFDAPAREECTAERPRSNTPLAALVLLNDPSYVEAARVFAQRALQTVQGSTHERLSWMSQVALARDIDQQERKVLMELLESERQTFERAPEEAERLLAVGLADPPAELEPAELAAWTSIARAVMNMHEFVTRN